MHEREQRRIFDDWLSRHKGILFKIVRANAYNPHDQDDLFQEIALQLWRSIPDFRGESQPSTWIYRVALYTALSWTRTEKRRPPIEPLANVERTLSVNLPSADPRLDWLYTQIGRLEGIDRALCLLLLDGFSYSEMAELVGISAGNVGVRIHRIKRHLTTQSKEFNHHGV